ncbi:MAG: hypothetical protein CMB99_12700 [Flavobacteriaceae bacterium]|nr:hypothetical protein [Flavobacteriaceae bacterium]|tara:strand:+ start:105446 stop:106156 length:711 start_codon:yes stop_codon:yes gene_type:complete
MRAIFVFAFLLLGITQTKAQTSTFNILLQSHVSEDGFVDYKGLKSNESTLDSYINYLKETNPENTWSTNKQKAFWINAYNAYTLKLILENYPTKSIMNINKDGKTAWKIPFAMVGGNNYTLDHIEHEILRKKLFDPRIHVGVNCASVSCPKLSNVAFTEENIDSELERLMKAFINDASRNKVSKKKIEISEIFNWFKDDFTKNGSIVDYFNKYSKTPVKANAKIRFLPYNWNLNGK